MVDLHGLFDGSKRVPRVVATVGAPYLPENVEMSVRRWRQTASFGLALVGSCAQEEHDSAQPSIFTNPGEMALICFEADDAKKYRDDPDLEPTLPLACCSKVIGTDAQIAARMVSCPGEPIAHALVTQIPRGETAAVDLLSARRS